MSSSGDELAKLVLGYVEQETVGPLKGLGRYLLAGMVGSVLLSGGVVVLLLALLRLLQTETGTTFAGHLSWIPYLIVAVVAVGIAAFAGWRITRGPAARAPEGKKQAA